MIWNLDRVIGLCGGAPALTDVDGEVIRVNLILPADKKELVGLAPRGTDVTTSRGLRHWVERSFRRMGRMTLTLGPRVDAENLLDVHRPGDVPPENAVLCIYSSDKYKLAAFQVQIGQVEFKAAANKKKCMFFCGLRIPVPSWVQQAVLLPECLPIKEKLKTRTIILKHPKKKSRRKNGNKSLKIYHSCSDAETEIPMSKYPGKKRASTYNNVVIVPVYSDAPNGAKLKILAPVVSTIIPDSRWCPDEGNRPTKDLKALPSKSRHRNTRISRANGEENVRKDLSRSQEKFENVPKLQPSRHFSEENVCSIVEKNTSERKSLKKDSGRCVNKKKLFEGFPSLGERVPNHGDGPLVPDEGTRHWEIKPTKKKSSRIPSKIEVNLEHQLPFYQLGPGFCNPSKALEIMYKLSIRQSAKSLNHKSFKKVPSISESKESLKRNVCLTSPPETAQLITNSILPKRKTVNSQKDDRKGRNLLKLTSLNPGRRFFTRSPRQFKMQSFVKSKLKPHRRRSSPPSHSRSMLGNKKDIGINNLKVKQPKPQLVEQESKQSSAPIKPTIKPHLETPPVLNKSILSVHTLLHGSSQNSSFKNNPAIKESNVSVSVPPWSSLKRKPLLSPVAPSDSRNNKK